VRWSSFQPPSIIVSCMVRWPTRNFIARHSFFIAGMQSRKKRNESGTISEVS
jgi:hypothetical protein